MTVFAEITVTVDDLAWLLFALDQENQRIGWNGLTDADRARWMRKGEMAVLALRSRKGDG